MDENNQNDGHSEPVLPELSELPDSPDININTAREITISLVNQAQEHECNFWIGLCKEGEVHPSELLNYSSVALLLAEAAKRGISDQGPVMLSNTELVPARYVYLLSTPPNDFRHRTVWLQDLIKTVGSWSPSSAGFYIAPELMDRDESHELLQQILREVVQHVPAQQFFLLIGNHGFNAMINTAIRLKAEIETEKLRVFICH